MPKLRAFTLMELLIGMIVSSIVIAFGYGSYDLIYKQYLRYRSVKSTVLETMQLNTVINNDFINAEYIFYADNKLKCNSTNKQQTYNFTDSLVIRVENEATDTFKLAANNIVIKPVFSPGTDNGNLINTILFDVSVLDTVEHFTFTKIYTAQTLMNYEMQLREKD